MLPAVDPGADQHQPVDELGSRERQVEGDVAAHRDPHDVRPDDPEGFEHGGDVGRVHERPVRERRLAEAAEIAGDHAEALREHGRHVVPHRPVCDPGMEEDDGRAVSGDVVCQIDAVDAELRHPEGG